MDHSSGKGARWFFSFLVAFLAVTALVLVPLGASYIGTKLAQIERPNGGSLLHTISDPSPCNRC
jgi:hypothetical protein